MTDRGSGTLQVEARLTDLRDIAVAVRRCQDLFDLDADPIAVAEVLRADPALRPLVDARPGLRVPGSADGFELAVRAVLGQQVSVAAARTFAGRLVRRFGEPLTPDERKNAADAHGSTPELTSDQTPSGADQPAGWWLFPTARRLADAGVDELRAIGLTSRRATTLRQLARAATEGTLTLDRGADRAAETAALLALPGIGAWTAAYVGLRALGDPDAFPASDLGLRRAAAALGLPAEPAELTAHAERWRPWRGYAALHLWSHLSTLPAAATTPAPG
jgi:AraC family transcriptional regulator of adaptative response / DNA-3-methyladenine glycosylase II